MSERTRPHGDGQWRAITLLLLLVLVPSTCMLWLLSQARRNERLAARQALNDAYMSHLRAAAERLESRLVEITNEVTAAADSRSAAEPFLTCLERDWCDGLVQIREKGDGRAPPNADLVQVPTALRGRWDAARQLAEDFLARGPRTRLEPRLRPTGLADVWSIATTDRKYLLLLRQPRIMRMAAAVMAASSLPEHASLELLAPDDDPAPTAYLLKMAGQSFPGWRLALSLDRNALVQTAGMTRVVWYQTMALLAIGTVAGLALLVGVMLQRQSRLARLKNDLVATVSHELKTPLASMRLLIDTLLETDDLPVTQIREYLELVARENTRLTRLIDNFLTFSRMERHKHRFQPVPLAPGRLLRQALDAAGDRFHAADCFLEVSVAEDLPQVLADEDALVTVLLNLLDNAYKYTPPPRRLALRVDQQKTDVCFAVQDNGIGMTRAVARRVFDRFYQAEKHLSRAAGGCGLGLSIVEYIVQAHAGAIEVYSEPGQGSRFVVRLPAVPRQTSLRQEACVS